MGEGRRGPIRWGGEGKEQDDSHTNRLGHCWHCPPLPLLVLLLLLRVMGWLAAGHQERGKVDLQTIMELASRGEQMAIPTWFSRGF